MKQLIFLFLGVAAFIIAVGYYSKTSLPKKSSASAPTKKEISIGDIKITATVADSEDERRTGLGGRGNLTENEGMLFVYPEKTSGVVFWMKDMRFPIDIIWIADSKIVKIDKNVEVQTGVSDDKLKRYYPGTDVNFVLEVNAGFADKNGVKAGSEVQIPKAP